MAPRVPLLAALLSLLLPGAGQLYNGERAKGITILCITGGIGYGLCMATLGPGAFRSVFSVCMLVVVYLFVWVPAVIDAYQRAAGQPTALLSGEKAWYVILMLATVGPMAIPLLWQSRTFSHAAKIGWTVAVILLAILAVVFLLFIGPTVERSLHDVMGTLQDIQ